MGAREISLVEELDAGVVPIYNDERGEVGDFSSFSKVEGLHVVTMRPGAVRGNNVHDRVEIICVVGGSGICEITVADEASGESQDIVVEGDVKTYRIKAGIKHTVRNSGNEVFHLVVFMTVVPVYKVD